MFVSPDNFDALGDDDDGEEDISKGKKIIPTNSRGERQPNAYDDPSDFFITREVRSVIYFVCWIQSNSVLVFLRYRIGKRVMRGWIFQFLFIVLASLSGCFNFVAWFGNKFPGDKMMGLFAVAMGILAIYHYHVARELTEPDIPIDLQLHTRARGDSHLMWLMRSKRPLKLPMLHFYTRRIRSVQVYPFDELTMQRVIEPLLLVVLAGILTVTGHWQLGTWLSTSALCLTFVETEYQIGAEKAMDDKYDGRLESRAMRMTEEALEQKAKNLQPKINGIPTAGMARVSQALMQLQKKRIEGSK
ncbi:MAG: hypothetical protein KME46_32720 [Brasilonema angustatum HA4187-MV1]|jgi:hypothetical protein|nr:hypothetical protein [Brasilonema angustatum HA4187-MV1]